MRSKSNIGVERIWEIIGRSELPTDKELREQLEDKYVLELTIKNLVQLAKNPRREVSSLDTRWFKIAFKIYQALPDDDPIRKRYQPTEVRGAFSQYP